MSSRSGYSRLQIGLHWLIALLIFAGWFTGEGMGRALHDRLQAGSTGFSDATVHVWLGVGIFALIAIRILVRLMQGAPAAAHGGSALMDAAAVWGHRVLYLLMILAPLGGVVTWFVGIESAGEIHALIGNALFFVALAHAAVAILHQVVLKDGTLTRMVRPRV